MATQLGNPILNRASSSLSPDPDPGSTLEATQLEVLAPPSEKLAAIEATLAAQTALVTSSIAELDQAREQTATSGAVIESALKDIAVANQTVQSVKLVEEMRAQNNVIDAFETMGGSEQQIALLEELAIDQERTSNLLEKKVDISDDVITGISLIDGVINDFRSIQVDAQTDAALRKEEHTARQVQTIASSTESVARTSAITQRTLNDATIAEELKKQAAVSTIQLSEQQIKNVGSNADAVAKIYQMNQNQLASQLQVFRLEGEAEGRELAKERNKFAREELAFKRDSLAANKEAAGLELKLLQERLAVVTSPAAKVALEAKQTLAIKSATDTIKTERALVDTVQKAQVASKTAVESSELILFGLRQTGAAGRKYDRLLDIGSSTQVSLGSTPYDAKVSLETIAPSGNFGETAGTKLLERVTVLQDAKYKTSGAPRDEATLEADYNTTARDLEAELKLDIRTGDLSNPFHAPPMAVLADVPAVSNSALYREGLEPMGMLETDPQKIINAAVNTILAGKITAEEAADGIVTIFLAAANLNSSVEGGLARAGFSKQTSYNTLLEKPLTTFENLLVGATPLGIVTDVGKDLLRDTPVGTSFANRFQPKLISVNLLDRAAVQQAIVITLANAKPPESSTELERNLANQNAE